jgi:hypothetical protein
MAVFEFLIGVALISFGGWILWESTMMVEEKKQRRRMGLTDYYDNPIKKDEKR